MSDTSDVWSGRAYSYDHVRPSPPSAIIELLTQMIGMPHPALVVDVGSGTGLSTMIWGGRAEQVIGIDPNEDMRREATSKLANHPQATHIEYREGVADQTDLPDGCADIVTAAQSFHWMEPAATLAEIARILRPGGLFAAYDYDSPPTIHWELDRIALEGTARMIGLMRERGLAQSINIWPGNKTLDPLHESGRFRFTREVCLHSIENGDAARYTEMMQSSAFSGQFQFTEEEIGLDRLRQAALHSIGSQPLPWYFSYRVRIGIK